MDINYIFFLPRTEIPGRRKRFLVVEEGPKIPVIVTETGSIRHAVDQIAELVRKPSMPDVIVDVDCDTGRDLLFRTFPMFTREKFENRFYVSQIFQQVCGSMPAKTIAAESVFIKEVKGLLLGPRSNGGRRPFVPSDGLIAEIGVRKKRSSLPSGTIRTLSEHSLCTLPRFLMEETHRNADRVIEFDEDALKQDMILLATNIAQTRQGPFPIGPYRWLFPANDWPTNDCRRSSLHDFLFAVLDSGTRRRKKIRERFPAQSRIIDILNRLVRTLELPSSGLFRDDVCARRYDLICALLQLIFETWTLSLYRDQENKPQIVDLSLMNYATSKNFEKTLSLI